MTQIDYTQMVLTYHKSRVKKRALDLVVGVPLLLVSLPVQALVVILVRLSSKGPILHRATRVGLEGHQFTMFKFRTMRIGMAGTLVTASGDPRITRIGHHLRSLKLDELPQLFQVVSGTMSLVGRRPEDPQHIVHYTLEQTKVFAVPPSLTGPAVVVDEEKVLSGCTSEEIESTYIRDFVPAKVQTNLDYLENWTLRTDLNILFETAVSLIPGLDIKWKKSGVTKQLDAHERSLPLGLPFAPQQDYGTLNANVQMFGALEFPEQ